MNKRVRVFQVYYDKRSEENLDKGFIPYENTVKDKFFENTVIKDIYNQNIDCDYIGITSWRCKWKTGNTSKEILDAINQNEADIYVYSENFRFIGGNIWKCEIEERKDILIGAQLLNEAHILPFDLFRTPWVPCFCNYWIAKKEIFNDYVKNILIPVMEWMQKEEVQEKFKDLKFVHRHNEVVGVECMVLEGLMGSYLAHNNYKVHNIDIHENLRKDGIFIDRDSGCYYLREKGIIKKLYKDSEGILRLDDYKEDQLEII